jgi:vacuolar-type H+-ATPase subunit H
MPASLLTSFVQDSIKQTTVVINEVLDAVSGAEADARDFVRDTRQLATEHVTIAKDTLRDLVTSTRDEASDFLDATRDESNEYVVALRDNAKDLATDARQATLKVASDVRASASDVIRGSLQGVRNSSDRLHAVSAAPKKVARPVNK